MTAAPGRAEAGESGWRTIRSIGFRIAALHAALMALSAGALVAVLWWNTAGYLDRQVERGLRGDIAAFAADHRAGGLAAVATAIETRIAEDSDNEAIYLLLDARGAKRAGNLDAWPAFLSPDAEAGEGRLTREGTETTVRARALAFADGSRVMAGRDVGARRQLQALVAESVFYGLALAVVLAASGGLLVAQVLARRTAPLLATAAAIGQGDLARRAPLSGNDDEFDQLARSFNAMLDRLAGLMEGVRQVSNAIAHDLRTPIARTRAGLEDVLHGAAEPAALKAGIERGIEELDRVIDLFQALLRIAEIESGARRSAFAPFDLAQAVEDVAALYEPLAEAKGIRLETRVPPALKVVGDRDLAAQAVANLLDNAIKFTPEGGLVMVRVALAGAWAEVSVTDTGPGMPEGIRARATERFFRAEPCRSTPGFGLGLALVEAVAQLHGGRLELGPGDEGQGLAARLRLPTESAA
ncbi:sensor histidine kinase [Elioraea thermophila]|uniref:sensor histidine kinase n=1 Tax=Elioraea thermophila TaxID=2185104 RepID=UPI000DF1944D|nr:HAMP domain-containing sensor histidine kinase [Elioraea thermophila]